MSRAWPAAILLSCGFVIACRETRPRVSPQPSAVSEFFYPLRGTVKAIAADRRSVTLDHEEIPGLMGAMEMEFSVVDPSVLSGIETGARVEGTLRLRGRGPSITRLVRRAP